MSVSHSFETETFKQNQYNDKYLYSVNRGSFEKESYASVFDSHFSDDLYKEEKLYIILGTDSGLLSSYIINRGAPEGSRYIFIELPHIIEKIQENIPSDYDSNTYAFITADDWKDLAEKFEINVYIYKDSISYIKSLAAVDSYLIEYHETNLKIVKDLEITFFFTRALVGVFPFMTTQLTNISDNKHSLTLLNNVFTGKTCIILGGGPSLDDDIFWIKANQDNLVIIAVSRVCKTLLKNNITPHMVVCVDPYDVSFDVSKELLLLPKEVLFINANCVISPLLHQWHGRNVCIGARFPWHDPVDDDSSIMAGPTVTNTALKAAIEMGFSNILLTGVDLCYSSSGVTHAKDSIEANVGPTLGQPGIWVTTYAGNKAETQIAFDNAISSLSKQAKEALEQDIHIYNLSENAAVAEYIEYMPTSALSFENEENNAWEIIENNLPKITTESIRQDNNFVLERVSKVLKDIKAIKKLSIEALECNEKLFAVKGKESENFKFKLRMDKIEKIFDSKYKKTSKFVKNFGLDKFIKCVQTSHEYWSDDKVEKTGQVYYQAYVDSSTILEQHLEESVLRIKSRIEEEKPIANVNVLLEQWTKDHAFHRAAVWLENHPEQATLNDNDRNKFVELEQKFISIINDEKSKHLDIITEEASLNGVKRKIIILFTQRNLEALEVMTHSLSLYDKTNKQAAELHIIALAYLSVLKENHQQALTYFEQLDTEKYSEDELQQIVTLGIKLSLYDKSAWALERLSNLSDRFTTQYAKILKLLGNYQASIEVYTEYLSNYPDDHKSWLALGKLYTDIEAFDAAEIAFKYVLNKEPNNIYAIELLNNVTNK